MMQYDSRPLMLFGAHGRLGTAIAEAAAHAGRPVARITWAETKPWRSNDDSAAILERFAEACETTAIDVVFANGLSDPAQALQELIYSNCEFPLKVIEAMRRAPGMRFLTVGTVMEEFPRLAEANRYVASKRALEARIRVFTQDPLYSQRLLHLRLHTLYGGAPAPHLFLGQICASLQRNEPFLMSSGEQLREYHHVGDVARAVLMLCGRYWDTACTLALSFGQPVRLRTLAEKIFANFGRSHLLHVGQLSTPDAENFETLIPRSPEWLIGHAREPIKGVIEWLAVLIGGVKATQRNHVQARCP